MKKPSLILFFFSCLGHFTLSQTVTIGSQVWMTNNLNVSTFRNGDSIPYAKTAEEWKRACYEQRPVWCYYDNDTSKGAKYGKLYNWYAVNDPRGLAPQGWHVPSDNEWNTLTNYLGGEGNAVKKMKSTSGWNRNSNGTNESGFTGLPGGRFNFFNFDSFGSVGWWWSSTQYDRELAWVRSLSWNSGDPYRYYTFKFEGFSVRCLRTSAVVLVNPIQQVKSEPTIVYGADALTGERTSKILYYVQDGIVYGADSHDGRMTNIRLRYIVGNKVYAADSQTGERTGKVLRYIISGIVYGADSFTGAQTDKKLMYIQAGKVYAADGATGARTNKVLRHIIGNSLTD